jgi:bla regulator protein blaR1
MMPLQPLANHLWQSTLFAAVAGLMTPVLRRNRAQTRYGLWLAASVKFLIPFSVLVEMGGRFGWHTERAMAMTQSAIPAVIEQVSRPFAAPVPLVTIPAAQSSFDSWIPTIIYGVWAIGFLTLAFCWWLRWRSLRAMLRAASPLDLPIWARKTTGGKTAGVTAVMTSSAFVEPGVFGCGGEVFARCCARHRLSICPSGREKPPAARPPALPRS